MDHDSGDEHLPCSTNSSTETASNIPGTGRILGIAYDFLGKRLEDGLVTLAHSLGRRPRAVAVRIRKTRTQSLQPEVRQRELENAGKSLVEYIRQVVIMSVHGQGLQSSGPTPTRLKMMY